ncbi:MAG: hypothetical protein ACRYFA_00955 [Janthinobacterium lividum]
MRLFEFEDLSWFPNVIRSGMTDFLRYFIRLLNVYQPITPLLIEVLEKTNENNVIDLGSGGGGAIEQIHQNISRQTMQSIQITLTDKFPNPAAWQYIHQKTNGLINFYADPVDANLVPDQLKGVRTLFSAAHHFKPAQLQSILKAAVRQQKGICLFDGGDKNPLMFLGAIIFQPLFFFFLTPFIRPFKISRILFTYLIPVIPFCTVWDGCVSLVRLYRPKELLQLAESISNQNYTWKAGRVKNKLGLHVTYLIGYPNLDTEF